MSVCICISVVLTSRQAEVFLDEGRCSFSGGSTTVVALLQRLRQAAASGLGTLRLTMDSPLLRTKDTKKIQTRYQNMKKERLCQTEQTDFWLQGVTHTECYCFRVALLFKGQVMTGRTVHFYQRGVPLAESIDALLLQKIHTPSVSITGTAAAQCVAILLSTDGLGAEEKKIRLRKVWIKGGLFSH